MSTDVDPVIIGHSVLHEFIGLEPEGNLVLGRLDRVRAVAKVTAGDGGEIEADG